MKGNATILASILAITLVAAGVGAGTMAWFSGAQTGTGSFTTGTLTLGTTSYSGYTVPNLSPGDTWTTSIVLTNTGSLDAKYVYAGFYITADPSGLSDKIVLTQIHDWCTSDGWATGSFATPAEANVFLHFWDPSGTHDDGSISLYDLATVAMTGPPGGSTTTSLRMHTAADASGVYLPAGAQCQIDLTFKLLENTPNAYQGQTCSFAIKFTATNAILPTDVDTLS